MGKDTLIEWAHHTFNHVRGCTKVSEGCKNCYAEKLAGFRGKSFGVWGPSGDRVIAAESKWREPLAWDRAAKAAGERHRVFCASLADVFEGPETMPRSAVHQVRQARLRLIALIGETPNLDWLLLTKRPQNIRPLLEDLRDATDLNMMGRTRDQLREWLDSGPPANVRVGTSIENQETANERLPHLLKLGWPNFVSYEPALGPVDLQRIKRPIGYLDSLDGRMHDGFDLDLEDDITIGGIDWLIAGGESGPSARPAHPDWFRSVRDQCQWGYVPFLMKQWGEWITTGQLNDSLNGRLIDAFKKPTEEWPDGLKRYRVGKAMAGRHLDGVIHNEFPAPKEVARA